jgi:hypothetical protein
MKNAAAQEQAPAIGMPASPDLFARLDARNSRHGSSGLRVRFASAPPVDDESDISP